MPEAHPAHVGLPALYRAEAGAYRGRWRITVYGPDRNTVAGPVALGRAGTFTTAHPDDPGRRLIAISGEVPVLPRLEAEHALAEHGFVVEAVAPRTPRLTTAGARSPPSGGRPRASLLRNGRG